MLPVDVLDAARELQQFLAVRQWPYALIGGLAVVCRAKPRATVDVDISLLCELGAEHRMIDPLLEAFKPRIDDAADFAIQNGVLLLSASNGVALDIGLALFPFEAAIISRAIPTRLSDDLEMPVVSAEDLVMTKSFAGRPQDWADIYNLIRHAGPLDWPAIEARLQSIAELVDIDEVLTHLQQLREQARSPKS
jgi:hypothetical protein